MEFNNKFIINPNIKLNISNFTKDIQDEFSDIFERHYYNDSGAMYLIFNLLSPFSVKNLSFLNTMYKLDEINLIYKTIHIDIQQSRRIGNNYNPGLWSPAGGHHLPRLNSNPLLPSEMFINKKLISIDHKELGISKNIYFIFKCESSTSLNNIHFSINSGTYPHYEHISYLFSVCGNVKYRNHITSGLSNNQLSTIYYTMIANHLFRLIYSVFNLDLFTHMKVKDMESKKLQILIYK
jgi:hypothetical protein